MALPASRDIDIYGGMPYHHELVFVDGLDGDTPLDLSGRTWAAQWRKDPLAETAVDFAVDASDAANGVVVISLTVEQVMTLDRVGVYDVFATAAGEPEALARGRATKHPQVTR